jgi:hypothetical protein
MEGQMGELRKLNALKHGLSAAGLLVAGEDATVWERFEGLFLEELAPVGPVEQFLAHRVAAAAWRLARVERLEGALDAARFSESLALVKAGGGLAARHDRWKLPDPAAYDGLAKLARHEGVVERTFFRSLRALRAAQAERMRGAVRRKAR